MTETEETIEQYKQVHQNKRYGVSSFLILKHYEEYVKQLKPQSVLDYGCGQGGLIERFKGYIPHRVQYDPALPDYDKLPKGTFDLVINTDVMEHVPESGLDGILSTIKSYSSNVVFAISLVEAVEILPNGDNAHCTVKPKEWWKELLGKYFNHVGEVVTKDNDIVIYKTF